MQLTKRPSSDNLQLLVQLQPLSRKYGLSINIALTLLMLVMGVLLFQPALDWAWQKIARPDRQYHLVVAVSILTLCAYRLWIEKHPFRFARSNFTATFLVYATCGVYLLNQYYLQLNALSVALFLLFCFGLLGHFVSTSAWRSCLLPLFLAMLVLPFEGYLDIFLGFPMRLLSAEVAAHVMNAVGVASVSSDTVLLIDNRAAIVDIDCSGIRGFWIGSVFFCAITWIERYRINLRWLLIAGFAALMLFIGNVFRIVALVLLDLVFDKGEWAQILHESLGLFSFSLVIFMSWQLMRLYALRHPAVKANTSNKDDSKGWTTQPSKTTLLLMCALLIFNALLLNKTESSRSAASTVWNIDLAENRYTPEALNTIERNFFSDHGATAYKYSSSVDFDGLRHKASVLVVISGHWKAQHKPEHCYIAQGFKVQSSSVNKMVDANRTHEMSFRQLSLSKNSVNATYTSDYWFQSVDTTTVNYSRRVLAQLKNPDTPWAMVSVLWHDGVPSKARQQLLRDIQATVSRNMNDHG